MPNKFDREGAILLTINEITLAESKNGFPEARFKGSVDKFYADTPEMMAHFQITEPAYVDYSTFDFAFFGRLTLFGKNGETFSYADLQKATGWDGTTFESLNASVGKQILVRTKFDTYEGKTNLIAAGIDAADADPIRGLKGLEPTAAQALLNKFVSKKSPVAIATAPRPVATAPKLPVAKPTVAAVTAPPPPVVAANPTPVVVTTATAGVAAPATASAPAAAAPAVKAAKTKAVKAPKADDPAQAKLASWNHVNSIKGETSDDDLGKEWQAACGEVAAEKGEGTTEEQFTAEDWVKVTAIVVNDLGLKAAE